MDLCLPYLSLCYSRLPKAFEFFKEKAFEFFKEIDTGFK